MLFSAGQPFLHIFNHSSSNIAREETDEESGASELRWGTEIVLIMELSW